MQQAGIDMSKLAPWPSSAGAQKPVVLLGCGSYSPITYLHLRMFEQARDHMVSGGATVLGGFISPVSDGYKKKGLARAQHRAAMVGLAVASSKWIAPSFWECANDEWTTTYNVLAEHRRRVAAHYERSIDDVRIMLVCGSDLLDSFNVPQLWAPEDMRALLSFGMLVLERAGTDATKVIYENDLMFEHRANLHVVKQYIKNEVSSTAIRRSIRRGLSIAYLTPQPVVDYIAEHGLYRGTDVNAGAAAAARAEQAQRLVATSTAAVSAAAAAAAADTLYSAASMRLAVMPLATSVMNVYTSARPIGGWNGS